MVIDTYKNSIIKPKADHRVKIYEASKELARFIVEKRGGTTKSGTTLRLRCLESMSTSFSKGRTYYRYAHRLNLCDCDNFQLCMFQFE